MRNLFHPREKILVAFVGALGFLGRGYWKIEYITLTDPTLNLCPVFERNHVKLLNHSLWGFCCWVWVANPMKQPIDSQRGNQE